MSSNTELNKYTQQLMRRAATYIKKYLETEYEILVIVRGPLEQHAISVVLPSFDFEKRTKIIDDINGGFLAFMIKENNLNVYYVDKNTV